MEYASRVRALLEDAIELFEESLTNTLYTRQAASLKKICRACRSKGIPIRVLDEVAKLTDLVIYTTKRGVDILIEPLKELIELHGIKFYRDKSFQALEYAKSQLKAISALTGAICCGDYGVVISVANTIRRFARQIIAEGKVVSRLVSEFESMLKVEQGSKTAENQGETGNVGSCSGVVNKNHSHSSDIRPVTVLVALLEALKEVSGDPGCCRLSVSHGILPMLANALRSNPPTLLIKLAVETIWNILETQPSSSVEFGSVDANLQACSEVVLRIANCYRLCDKELRSDLATILCLLAINPKNHMPLVLNQCLVIAIRESTKIELTDHLPTSKTLSKADFEYKNILWAFILKCMSCELGLAVCIENKMTEAVVLHLDPEMSNHPALKLLNAHQRVELQSRAIQFLTKMLPRAPGLFVKHSIYDKLMGLISKHVKEAENKHVNKQKSNTNNHLTEVEHRLNNQALQALVKIVSRADCTHVILKVCDVRAVFALFNDNRNSPSDRANALRVLGLVCDGHSFNQRVFRKENGIKLLVKALNSTLKDGSDVEIMHSVIEGVRTCIVGNARNEAHFLKLSGIETVIEMLCVCPREMRAVTLACIADLLLNPKAVVYFWEWRGDLSVIRSNKTSMAQYLPTNKDNKWNHNENVDMSLDKGDVTSADERIRSGTKKPPPAVDVLIYLWDTHRPNTEMSNIMDDIYQATKSEDVEYDMDMAKIVFQSVQACPDTGDYKYKLDVSSKYNYMPREKVLAIRTHFDRLDADGNGSLDIHEMIPLARSMGVTTIEPSLLKNLVRTIDIDGDGQISFSEVMAFLIVQEYYFNRNKERSAQSLQNRRRRKEAQANLNGPNAQRLYKETTQGLTQENGCGLSMVDESIRHMIFSVVSLIGIQNPDLTKEQRSKLNIITKYEKLLQGLNWTRMRNEMVAELGAEGLEALDEDEEWIRNQVEEFEETVLTLKSFSYDQEAADKGFQSSLLDEFVGSVKLKIEQKGRALSEEYSRRPGVSAKQRRLTKDIKQEIVNNSLDMKGTLERTLKCTTEELDAYLEKTRSAKVLMEEKQQLQRHRRGSVDIPPEHPSTLMSMTMNQTVNATKGSVR